MKRTLIALVGIAALSACGGPLAREQPNSPPAWPLANLTEVSPRSHGSAAKAKAAEELLEVVPEEGEEPTGATPADDTTKKTKPEAAGHTEGSAPETGEAPPADPPQE